MVLTQFGLSLYYYKKPEVESFRDVVRGLPGPAVIVLLFLPGPDYCNPL